MLMVKWNMELLIGIQEIDNNHRHLVQLLNEAYDEFVMGINIEEFWIDQLFNCMANCFDCEETWMIDTSYPAFLQHRSEHELFTLRFMEINSNYQQNANTSVEILMFLNNWISHHIRETDSKFGNFVEVQNLTKRFNREHPKQKTT